EIAVVVHVGDVRGGRHRHAARHRPVVQDDDGAPRLREQIGGGETGNARVDDAGIRMNVFLQRRKLRHRRIRPDRSMEGHEGPPCNKWTYPLFSRSVTNSSAAVGWMPMVASNCALVAPSFTAIAT